MTQLFQNLCQFCEPGPRKLYSLVLFNRIFGDGALEKLMVALQELVEISIVESIFFTLSRSSGYGAVRELFRRPFSKSTIMTLHICECAVLPVGILVDGQDWLVVEQKQLFDVRCCNTIAVREREHV